ncbi:MAG TPA: flagellar hook-length control protein FliK [Terriglobales bacterium]|nr:flagellar hook-length control protein FliK [Terriglobales bacterium]
MAAAQYAAPAMSPSVECAAEWAVPPEIGPPQSNEALSQGFDSTAEIACEDGNPGDKAAVTPSAPDYLSTRAPIVDRIDGRAARETLPRPLCGERVIQGHWVGWNAEDQDQLRAINSDVLQRELTGKSNGAPGIDASVDRTNLPADAGDVAPMTEHVAPTHVVNDADSSTSRSKLIDGLPALSSLEHNAPLSIASPVRDQFHGQAISKQSAVTDASATDQIAEGRSEAIPSTPTKHEPAVTNDFNGGGESGQAQQNIFSGEDRGAWSGSAQQNSAANERTIHLAAPFHAVVVRAEQSGGEPPAATWRPMVDHIAGEIAGHMRFGKSEAVLQLDPPELGKIKIDLRMEDGKLHARIVAEGRESKALIEAHLPELHQVLSASRIEVADVYVSQGSWSSTDNLNQGFQQQPRRQESGNGFDSAFAPSREGEEGRAQSLPRDNGRVSMWA